MQGKITRFFDKYNWWRLLAWILIVYVGLAKLGMDHSFVEAFMNALGVWAMIHIGVKMSKKDNDLTWGE